MNELRQLPQDLDAERACLGSMCIYAEAIARVVPLVSESDFCMATHGKLFSVIVDMWNRGEPVDLVTLTREVAKKPHLLAALGGAEQCKDMLVGFAESVPSISNAEHYARIIYDMSRRRQLIAAAQLVEAKAHDIATAWEEVKDDIQAVVMEISAERKAGAEPQAIGSLLEEVFASITSGVVDGLSTGFAPLDDMLCGLHAGEFVVIAGRPAMGKSAFGLALAERIALRGDPVAFFSLEMQKRELVQRMLCSIGQVDSHMVRRGWSSPTEIGKLKEAADRLNSAPLIIDDTMYLSVMELRGLLRRMVMQHRIKAAFIDYLQLMRAPKAENRQVAVSEISRQLKGIARELKIPVVVLAQLNRGTEGREEKRPRMSDLRESGAIEQDADVVMLLHREEYYKRENCPEELRGVCEIIIDKQRNGPTGTVKLVFNSQFTRFTTNAETSYQSVPQQAPPPVPRSPQFPFLAAESDRDDDGGDTPF